MVTVILEKLMKIHLRQNFNLVRVFIGTYNATELRTLINHCGTLFRNVKALRSVTVSSVAQFAIIFEN